jgi:WD40 repeat protein
LPEEISKIETKVVTSRSKEEKQKLEEFRTKDVAVQARMEGQQGSVYAVAFQPDGSVVASAGYDGVVRLNDTETGKLIKEFTPVPLEQVSDSELTHK